MGRTDPPHVGSEPITELPNDLSYYMDVSTAAEIVRMIRSCDGQLFSGFASYPSVYEKQVIKNLDGLTEFVAEMVAFPKDSAVILSGAGTSGRIAFMVARAFNAVLQQQKLPPCFHYLIAGGEEALLRPREGAEDDAETAVTDLKKLLAGGSRGKSYSRIVYIGISCGLTAIYVAAQLKYILQQKYSAGALIGFNSPEQAASTKPQNCNFTFADVVKELSRRIQVDEAQRFFLITPVLGPEAVAGSTRMKGGTATKVLLELVIGRAMAKVLRLPCLGDLPGSARLFVEAATKGTGGQGTKPRIGWQKAADAPLVPAATALAAYEGACRAAYQAAEEITELTEMMAQTWKNGGSVYYIGKGGLGLVGLLDASEQLPTFGARPSSLRAFVPGGWDAVVKPFEVKPPPPPSQPKVDPAWDEDSEDEDEEATEDEGEEEEGEVEEEDEEEEEEEGGKEQTKEEKEALLAKEAERRRQELFNSVSVDHFVKVVLPRAKPVDTVVLLESRATGSLEEFPQPLVAALLDRISNRGVNLALVTVQMAPHDRLLYTTYSDHEASNGEVEASKANGDTGAAEAESMETVFADAADVMVKVVLPASTAAPILPAGGVDTFGEIAVKVVLNAASTAAQALQGKVYGNRMIDLRIYNEKLLRRASQLVATLANVDIKEAERALDDIAALDSGPEKVVEGLEGKITPLSRLDKVIPSAVLACSGKYSAEGARKAALQTRSIRMVLGS